MLMIILNSKKGNSFFKEIKEFYENMLNLPCLECPSCGSTDVIRWGSYVRNVIYIDNDILKYEKIKIRRIRCKNCKHTHALIPSPIVPYKIYILDVILESFKEAKATLSISLDVVDKWNKQFNKFLPYLKTMFNNISKASIIERILQNIHYNYKHFFEMFKKILMMTRSGVVGMPLF